MEDKAKVTYVEEHQNPTPDLQAPPEGKAWRRKLDGVLFFGAIYMGKLFFLDGQRLEKPVVETPEDFDLVDVP